MAASPPASSPPQVGPPPAAKFQFIEREAARTPLRFHDRVLLQFRSPQNIAYLKGYLAKRKIPTTTIADAVYSFDRAIEVLQSDPLAMRGANRRAFDFWAEVVRLNTVFLSDRMKAVRLASEANGWDEPYHYRMFVADSLRPPGLEKLNSPGPLFALREDQIDTTSVKDAKTSLSATAPMPFGKPVNMFPSAVKEKYKSSSGAPSGTKHSTSFKFCEGKSAAKKSFVAAAPAPKPKEEDGDDAAWDDGDSERMPEELLAEYYGENVVATKRLVNSDSAGDKKTYGETHAWKDAHVKGFETRLMRYPSVPFWQKGGRQGYDYAINETLGTAARETDNHVRRWDMSRLLNSDGQNYRYYGARSGYVT